MRCITIRKPGLRCVLLALPILFWLGASPLLAQLTITGAMVDLNSGDVCPGDTLQYTYCITNNQMGKARLVTFNAPLKKDAFQSFTIVDGPLIPPAQDCSVPVIPDVADGRACLERFDIDGGGTLCIVIEAVLRDDIAVNEIFCAQGIASYQLNDFFSPILCTQVDCVPPDTPNLYLAKTLGGSMQEGATITVTLRLENRGSGVDTGILITDDIPRIVENLQVISASKGTWNYFPGQGAYGNGLLEVDIPAMDPDETVSIVFTLDLPVTCSGAQWGFCNQAEVKSDWITANEAGSRVSDNDDGDQFWPEKSCSGQIARTGDSNVSISLAGIDLDGQPTLAGHRIRFTASIPNTGECPDKDYWYRNHLPVGLRLIPGTVNIAPAGPVDNSMDPPAGLNGRGVVDVSGIDVDGLATVTITYDAEVESTADCTDLCNAGEFRSPFTNFSPTNEVCFLVGDPTGGTDIVVDKQVRDADGDPTLVNDTLIYTLSLTNNGPCEVSAGVLTDDVPPGVVLNPVSVFINDPFASDTSLAPPAGANQTGLVSFSDITIPSGGTVQATFEVTVTKDAGNQVCNEALATFSTTQLPSAVVCVDVLQCPAEPARVLGMKGWRPAGGSDIEWEWDPAIDAVSYSIYAIITGNTAFISNARAQTAASDPDDVRAVCQEVQAPCLHTDGLNEGGDLVYYQVIGVCLDGTEGSN